MTCAHDGCSWPSWPVRASRRSAACRRPSALLAERRRPPSTPAGPAAAPAAINGSGSTYVASGHAAVDVRGADPRASTSTTRRRAHRRAWPSSAIARSTSPAPRPSSRRSASAATTPSRAASSTSPTSPARSRSCTTSQDEAGRQVDYLHLSRSTVAKIFMGYITHWADPQITNDLGGQITLPHEPITVVYRAGQSGTTALFYDFVQNTEPELFAPVGRGAQPADDQPHHRARRSPNFAPRPTGRARLRPDRAVRRPHRRGRSATTSSATPRCTATTWRGSRTPPAQWVLPYAENISAALESAQLRPDLSQELRGVYASPNPRRLPDLGLQLHGHAVRDRRGPADVQGQLRQHGCHRDARRPGCATSRARARSRWPTSATRRCRRTCRSRSPTRSAACGAAAPRR